MQERLDRMQSDRVDLLQVHRPLEKSIGLRLSGRDTDALLAVPLAGLQRQKLSDRLTTHARPPARGENRDNWAMQF